MVPELHDALRPARAEGGSGLSGNTSCGISCVILVLIPAGDTRGSEPSLLLGAEERNVNIPCLTPTVCPGMPPALGSETSGTAKTISSAFITTC